MSEAADAAESAAARVCCKQTNKWPCCRGACQERCYATAAQQHAADATAAEQEALVAAAEEAAIATRQTKVVLHLRMIRQIPTKMRATTTVLTTMMTQLLVYADGDTDQVHGVRTQMALQVRVCLLSCAEEVCFKNVNAAQL